MDSIFLFSNPQIIQLLYIIAHSTNNIIDVYLFKNYSMLCSTYGLNVYMGSHCVYLCVVVLQVFGLEVVWATLKKMGLT